MSLQLLDTRAQLHHLALARLEALSSLVLRLGAVALDTSKLSPGLFSRGQAILHLGLNSHNLALQLLLHLAVIFTLLLHDRLHLLAAPHLLLYVRCVLHPHTLLLLHRPVERRLQILLLAPKHLVRLIRPLESLLLRLKLHRKQLGRVIVAHSLRCLRRLDLLLKPRVCAFELLDGIFRKLKPNLELHSRLDHLLNVLLQAFLLCSRCYARSFLNELRRGTRTIARLLRRKVTPRCHHLCRHDRLHLTNDSLARGPPTVLELVFALEKERVIGRHRSDGGS
mmetsp:Transcript_3283/g.11816  ORF Transcript_3283/g.11816 Transcript_3283/m.11816 type:complete len:281 (-) Transcript_3283:132-974(-)